MSARPPGPFTLRRARGVTLGGWPGMEALGVAAAVTTRRGGVSTGPYRSLNLGLHVGDDPAAVAENRRRAAGAFGCGVGDLVVAEQVHGAGVATVGAAERGRGARRAGDALAGADALVTADPAAVLMTLVADCVPVLLVDPAVPALSTVHAGWRGTVAKVTDAAVAALEALGARRERMVAALGPSVAPARYQVGDEVADALAASLGRRAGPLLAADGPGHWRLDLAGANRAALEAAGLRPGAIVGAPPTGGGGPFFSDRAARPCGRFALLARLRPYDGTAPPAT